MKKIKIRDKKLRSTAGKIIIGLILASMVGGVSALPAFGQDHRRQPPPNRDRYDRRDRDRNDRRDRDRDDYYRRRVYRDRDQDRRVYAPPSVVIEPPPLPPGLHIFLPRIIIR